jgi:dipeptidyl aminopeptidase
MAANPSMERHLYSAQLPATHLAADLEAFESSMEILTDTSKPGYYMTSFSPFGGYYMLVNVGPDVPWQKLVKVGEEGKHRLAALTCILIWVS